MLIAPNAPPRTRLLLAKRLSTSCRLAPTSTAVLKSRHRQQSRGFRLGPWSSHADSDVQRDARRRHRVLRYRYMESVSRKLPWEKTSQGDSPIAAIKAAMAENIDSATSAASGKYVNADNVKSWSDDVSGLRPGRNIEDVERDAMDHLFRHKTTEEYDMWKSPLDNIRNYLQSRRAPKEVTPEEVLHATTTADSSTGPAANPKQPAASQRNTKNVKPRPMSAGTADKANQQYEDLSKYSTPTIDNPNASRKLTPEEQSKLYNDLDKYKPVEWNEPDGLRKTTREEDSKQYGDLSKYKSSNIDDPNAPRELSPEEQSKLYNDLGKYKPVTWNEPNGLPSKTPEELSKNYNDLDKYGPVSWNEPDGLREPTPEELSKDYKDLDKYGPVSWDEPHGLRRLTPEEKSKEYKDLGKYSEGFVAKDSVLEAHEAKQMDGTVRGEPLAAKVEVPLEDPTKQYDDLDKYGPVRWNEPDGLRQLTPEELSKNYEDLHLYSQYENGDATEPRLHPEEVSKQYDDLKKYEAFPNAGPETERIHPEVASKQYSDLSRYPATGYEEPDKTIHVHPEELTKNYNDLDKYKPQAFDSPARLYPAHPEEATKAYDDLNRYKAVLHNEPDGKPEERTDAVASSLNAYDERLQSQEEKTSSATTHRRGRDKFFADFTETSMDFADSRTAQDIRSEVVRKARDNSQKQKLADAKSEHDVSWDATVADAQSGIQKSQQKVGGKLTGIYARDFPEEFSRSWSTAYSTSKSTLFPKDAADSATEASGYNAQEAESDEVEMSSMDESFPSEDSKLEPALNRTGSRQSSWRSNMTALERMQASKDPYSKSPQGLETSYTAEIGRGPTWPTFVRHHAAKTPDAATSATTAAESKDDKQPALYKILAYDPTMQSINVAETTSSAHDTASPANPADVLLRLSNPSKFFPHFRPLQAQGYEIVSGSGDVLVFRKVRDAPEGTASSVGTSQLNSSSVNPIDMMGKPATGNFASPTGFVNHDAVSGETSDKPAPPFRSNIYVRKEEPVFSGQKSGSGTKKKGSLGRKVVGGTVWAVGIAYAVGVMGQYFATGGADGLGPKGL